MDVEIVDRQQLASGYQNIFEELLLAYVRIAEALPRFDRFQVTFKGNAAFETVLAMVFADIAEFHRRAYKFFRRRGSTIYPFPIALLLTSFQRGTSFSNLVGRTSVAASTASYKAWSGIETFLIRRLYQSTWSRLASGDRRPKQTYGHVKRENELFNYREQSLG